MQEENQLVLPLVFINSEAVGESGTAAAVTFDYFTMGENLGKEIATVCGPDEKLYFLENEAMSVAGRKFMEGIRSGVAEGCEGTAASYAWTSDTEKTKILEKLTEGRTQKIILVAPEPESLLEAAQMIEDTEGAEEWVAGLYGRGSSVPILNFLDKGIIKGLCITDDFSAGYLSVKAAIELAEGGSVQTGNYLDSYFIRRGDLRNEKYEKILYPVE